VVPAAAGRKEGTILRLATRGSPLALRQAAMVGAALSAAHPGLVTEPVVVRTSGDRQPDVSLDRIGGQGVFTKEVQAAVADGRADVAVHSAKDLPPETPAGLTLAAVPERGDVRDALVGLPLEELPAGAVVATGSPRRRAQLANLRPDLTFADLRGNMDRRLRQAESGSVAAVVAAMVALDRLGWSDRAAAVLPVSLMLPQVGQGALALECREDDRATTSMLAAVDHGPSRRAVAAERAFLSSIGGSCALPVGALGHPAPGGGLLLEAMVASGDGRVVVRVVGRGDDPAALGRSLARRLLGEAGGSSIEGWAVEGRAREERDDDSATTVNGGVS
jgi:hydroxymethylbilane synthase